MARFTSSRTSMAKMRRSTRNWPLPAPNPAHIHVNKIRNRVVPDATASESQRRIPELRGSGPRKADIDRLGLHVKAVLGHTRRVGSKVLVAPRSAITADDVDLGVRATDGLGGIRQQVEKPGIEVMHLPGAMIPKEM